MTLKRLLPLATCLLAVAFPSAALAQSDQPGDSYLRPILLNGGDFDNPQPIGRGDIPGFGPLDTSTYGLQADLFSPPVSGGPQEPAGCGNTPYGNTVWAVFRAHRYGRADVTAAGSYDQVIGIVPFRSPSDPTPLISAGICVDRIRGIDEGFGNNPPHVAPGWYALQFGAAGGGGGILQGKLEFLPPQRVRGDAVLSWNGRSGGAQIGLKATGQKGARVSFKCAKKRCGKLPRARTFRKFTGDSLTRPIGDVLPRTAEGRVLREVADDDPAISAARSFIKRKFLKNGTRFEVRITYPGRIGSYFGWTVKKGAVGTKVKRCMEPGSSKPRRRCDG
jgi:hypothetical protein